MNNEALFGNCSANFDNCGVFLRNASVTIQEGILPSTNTYSLHIYDNVIIIEYKYKPWTHQFSLTCDTGRQIIIRFIIPCLISWKNIVTWSAIVESMHNSVSNDLSGSFNWNNTPFFQPAIIILYIIYCTGATINKWRQCRRVKNHLSAVKAVFLSKFWYRNYV